MIGRAWFPIAVLLLGASLSLASAQRPASQAVDADLDTIAGWLPGIYDTFGQADADAAAGTAYRHVRAVLTIVPIALAGAPAAARAFYLEQALAEDIAKPYRQRVLVLKRAGGEIANEIYRITNAVSFVGATRLAALRWTDLVLEAGCEAHWTRASSIAFTGSAGANGACQTTVQGATHVVSTFELTPTTLTSLDRGLDDSGAQRFGPPEAVMGHVFRKRAK
jgi:hypothetical protein